MLKKNQKIIIKILNSLKIKTLLKLITTIISNKKIKKTFLYSTIDHPKEYIKTQG